MPAASLVANDLILLALIALALGVLVFFAMALLDPSVRPSAAGKISANHFGPFDLAVVASLGVIFWLSARRGTLPSSEPEASDPAFAATLVALLLAYLVLARRIRVPEAFGLVNPKPISLLAGSLAAFAMAVATLFLAGRLFPGLTPFSVPELNGLADLLGFTLLVPLALELLFRGFVYGTIKRFSERFFAATISSLLFAAAVASPDGFSTRWLLGICLCIAYEVGGTLWVPILAHMALRLLIVP